MEKVYYNLENAETQDENDFFNFIYPLIKIQNIQSKKKIKIPLKLLIFFSQLQNILSINQLYQKTVSILEFNKNDQEITLDEFKYLIKRTEKWLEEVKKIIENEDDEKIKRTILQKISIFNILEEPATDFLNLYSKEQIKGLKMLREYFINNPDSDADSIQNKIFTIAKEDLKISPKKMFEAIYQIIFGKKYGPRLGSFLSMLDKNWLIERLKID